MKKFIYLSLILIGSFLMSCSDFLVENPTTSLDQTSVYSTKETANAALNGLYSTLSTYDNFAYRYLHVLSITSGSWVTTRTNEIPISTMQIQVNELHINNLFAAQYRSISVANDILCNLPASKIIAQSKDRIMGEAYFIRAMSYFNLVRQFGRISLITKPVQSLTEAQNRRVGIDTIYAQILNDLDSAYIKLPAAGTNTVGRPNKMAAPALKAKVYLTMAGNDETSPYWQKAYDAAKLVYDSHAYRLIRPFSNLFSTSNKNSAESIFEIQFSASVYDLKFTMCSLPLGCSLLPKSTGGNQFGKTRPCKDTYDLFVKTYPGDPRIDASFLHGTYYNLTQAKLINIYPNTTKTPGANGDDIEYPFIKKYVDPAFSITSGCNVIYYRYADLLLVLAEAANEIGKTPEAIGYVNEVLTRARDANGNNVIESTEIAPADWSLTLAKEDVRQRILTERQIELCGEADEWYTFRRRGESYLKQIIDRHNNHPAIFGKTTLNKFVYRLPDTEEDVKRNMLFPYPQAEINSNSSIPDTDQNYGY